MSEEEKIKGVNVVLDRIASVGVAKVKTKKTKKQKTKKPSLFDAAMAKMKERDAAWGTARDKATTEFVLLGITRLDDTTPGYRERIDELYRESGAADGGKWAEDWFKDN